MASADARGSDSQSFYWFVSWISVAAVAIYLLTYLDWGRFHALQEPMRGLAEAGFTAMLLAVTVDLYLKTALVRDAFNAAFGYTLPGYLQEELAAVHSLELVCTDHNQEVTLSELNNDLVQVSVKLDRTLTNIKSVTCIFNPSVEVDEWLDARHPSKIKAIGYRKSGGNEVHGSINNVKLAGLKLPRITVDLASIEVHPNESVTFWYESDETRHRNDIHMFKFRYSTKNPKVRLEVPLQLVACVEFGHRHNDSAKTTGKTTILSGLLLPYQCIIVRWWDRTQEQSWRRSLSQ